MDVFWNNLSGWITTLPPLLSGFIIILFIILYFFKDGINKILPNITLFNKKQKIEDLKYHNLFDLCDISKEEIKHIEYYTDGKLDITKTKMCIDFTNYKMDRVKKTFLEFCNIKGLDKLSTLELKTLVIDYINICNNTFMEEIKVLWLDKGIPKDDVEYLLDKFDEYTINLVTGLKEQCISICTLSQRNNNYERINSVLDNFSLAIRLIPSDMIKTFNDVNGKFYSIKY